MSSSAADRPDLLQGARHPNSWREPLGQSQMNSAVPSLLGDVAGRMLRDHARTRVRAPHSHVTATRNGCAAPSAARRRYGATTKFQTGPERRRPSPAKANGPLETLCMQLSCCTYSPAGWGECSAVVRVGRRIIDVDSGHVSPGDGGPCRPPSDGSPSPSRLPVPSPSCSPLEEADRDPTHAEPSRRVARASATTAPVRRSGRTVRWASTEHAVAVIASKSASRAREPPAPTGAPAVFTVCEVPTKRAWQEALRRVTGPSTESRSRLRTLR